MQLLGQPVHHITFGKGTITGVSPTIVTVNFPQGEKHFIYPEAFIDYLTLKDANKQEQIHNAYHRRLKEEEEAQKQEHEKQIRRKKIRTMKLAPNSQAAFHIPVSDVEKIFASGSIFSGCYLSGLSKGEPRIPHRLKPNSACLLTGLPDGRKEQDRRILGVFMVHEDFWGEQCEDGNIIAHGQHRLCLPADTELSFWDYFEHGKAYPRWGSVPFKYFGNSTLQRILLDMIHLLANTDQGAAAKEFYQYYSEINRLPGLPVREEAANI